MKTIKAIAAVVLAMFVGSANADVKLTKEAIIDYADNADLFFETDDVQCSLVAKMQVKGAVYAFENAGKDLMKDLSRLSYKATINFPYREMDLGEFSENFMEKGDQLRAMYHGAYIMIALNISYNLAHKKEVSISKDIVDSYEARRKFYDEEFYICMEDKEKYPEYFRYYYAAGRLAEGDF